MPQEKAIAYRSSSVPPQPVSACPHTASRQTQPNASRVTGVVGAMEASVRCSKGFQRAGSQACHVHMSMWGLSKYVCTISTSSFRIEEQGHAGLLLVKGTN